MICSVPILLVEETAVYPEGTSILGGEVTILILFFPRILDKD
jgi:hypothetical protein